MAAEKKRKFSGFVIQSYLLEKDSAFTAVQRMQSSKLGSEKGTTCQQRVYERGTFSVKNGI